MRLIVCVSNGNGMMFNHRRQSKDRKVMQDIAERTAGKKIWMNAYSAQLFSEYGMENILVDEGFLSLAGKEDFCFWEGQDILPYVKGVDQWILYRWNRNYPMDVRFDEHLTDGFKLESSVDFAGSSHEKITREVYVR
ncbi:MAG: ribonuclease Z [Lachnospiraceae bacterium]|nr:ribonuclease Z [Lachnospiraceae bacterium]